jgi:energy-coupling factor transport system permease protein
LTSIPHIPFNRVRPGDSFVHRLSPGVKLVWSAFYVLSMVWISRWHELALVAGLTLPALILARAGLSDAFKDVWSLRFFYLITLALHLLLDAGHPLILLPLGLSVSALGLDRGLFFSAKIALIATMMGVVLRTTHPSEWVEALELSSRGQGRLSRAVRGFALTLGLAIRFLPLILAEAERIRWAQVSRGLQIQGGLVKRVKTLIPLLVPLMAAALDRANGITAAMLSRGFDLDAPRTRYQAAKFTWRDATALVGAAAIIAISLGPRIYGWIR